MTLKNKRTFWGIFNLLGIFYFYFDCSEYIYKIVTKFNECFWIFKNIKNSKKHEKYVYTLTTFIENKCTI